METNERPSKISATLRIIEAEFPADVIAVLEAYIEELEACCVKPLTVSDATQSSSAKMPAVWSHQRLKARQARIRERALKKLDHYRSK